ncbi:MAG: hypothetical protein AB1473_18600 [Thermodesulfobacteriota bacterium]
MDPSHALPCMQCHRGNPQADDQDKAHEGLIKDPGALGTVDRTCGKCHPEEARRVKRSSMALAPRMINHTRFAFGGQKSPAPRHSTVALESLAQVPHPFDSSNLGDDLLRRSCLRCHIHTKGSTRWGEHRGLGCSACHSPFPNSEDGKPRPHAIVRSTGMTACLKCHNSNHVGAAYVGLFEKDLDRGFRTPFVDGKQPPRMYGAEHHRLAADIHFRAGMTCMDCHTLDEIHGTGDLPASPYPAVTVTCEGCHVRGDHPAVMKEQDGTFVLIRGADRRIPLWKADSVPHSVQAHRDRLRCSACHALWSFQDYGLHLMLEERADYWKWATNAAQNDPQVQQILEQNVGTFVDPIPPQTGSKPAKPMEEWTLPRTTDWLSGESRSGAWFRGYTTRRWERPPLGMDHKGKIAVMRPMYQYVVSHVDAQDNLLLDRDIPTMGSGKRALVWNPYTPHNTAKIGRQCHECHGDPKAVGLGEGFTSQKKPGFKPVWLPEEKIPGKQFRWDALVDEQGNPFQNSTHPSAGPLDAATVKKLLNPSDAHRALWYKYLKRDKTDP